MEVKYNSGGRMLYHPEFHFAQGRDYTISELEYICKFHDFDGLESVSMAIGKSPSSVTHQIQKLKKSNEYEFYRNLNVFYV